MPVRVLSAQGDVLATIDGRVLGTDLPPGFELAARGNDLELREPAGGIYCGQVTLPYVRNGSLGVATVPIDPPDPWSWRDLRTMWEASVRIRGYRAGRGGTTPWGAGRRVPSGQALAWAGVQKCMREARRLTTRWPQRYASIRRSVPVGIALGVEDLRDTERAFSQGAIAPLRTHHRVIPMHSQRALGATVHWRSQRVTAAARGVLGAVSDAMSRWEREEHGLVEPLHSVMVHSSTAIPDVSASSWPNQFRTFYGTAIEALSAIEYARHGQHGVPLVRVWELYEDWVAERLLVVLSRLLGPSSRPPSHPMLGHWKTVTGEVALYFKPSFTLTPTDILGSRFLGVIGDSLIPDVVIAAQVNGTARLMAIDAKDRREISPGMLAEEASKYLWGIRRNYDAVRGHMPDAVPALEGVMLLAPCGGAASNHLPLGRATSVHAAPHGLPGAPVGTVGQGLCQQLVRDWLAQLAYVV